MGYMVPGLFIEKAVVPSSGNNLKFFPTYHIVEHIGIYTCRIYHVLCMHLTIIRNQPVAEIRFFNLNTSVFILNSTPFSYAFSAMAMVRPKGHTIPPVAHR